MRWDIATKKIQMTVKTKIESFVLKLNHQSAFSNLTFYMSVFPLFFVCKSGVVGVFFPFPAAICEKTTTKKLMRKSPIEMTQVAEPKLVAGQTLLRTEFSSHIQQSSGRRTSFSKGIGEKEEGQRRGWR